MATDDLEILRVDCKGYEFVGRPYQLPASGMDHYWTLAELKILLARQGLYVVTASEKSELAQLREKRAKAIYMLENYDLSGSMLALEVLRG